jgi:hypothetical protein
MPTATCQTQTTITESHICLGCDNFRAYNQIGVVEQQELGFYDITDGSEAVEHVARMDGRRVGEVYCTFMCGAIQE